MMNNALDYGEVWKTMMSESKKTNFESDRFWTMEEAVKYDRQIKMDDWNFSKNLIKGSISPRIRKSLILEPVPVL